MRFAPIFEVPFLFYVLWAVFVSLLGFFCVGVSKARSFRCSKSGSLEGKNQGNLSGGCCQLGSVCIVVLVFLVFFSDEAMVECLNFRSRLWHRSNVFSTVFYQEMSLGPPPCSKVLSLLLLCLANLSFLEFGLSFTQLQNRIVMLFLWWQQHSYNARFETWGLGEITTTYDQFWIVKSEACNIRAVGST